jgi:hypothetical protein
VNFSGETATGWQTARFATPISVRAGTTYIASYHTAVGRYAATNNFFASSGVAAPPLRALATGVDGPNGVYRYGASGFPNSSFQSTNYWVDVVFIAASGSTGGTGLAAEYFDNADFTGTRVTRTDASVNFNWGNGSPATGITPRPRTLARSRWSRARSTTSGSSSTKAAAVPAPACRGRARVSPSRSCQRRGYSRARRRLRRLRRGGDTFLPWHGGP